ncbi:MAG TPA: YCF48-related protein [Candidatus Solibacter sp.]|nr:YCF48-related protein [Candidatus Solibacter sp.]
MSTIPKIVLARLKADAAATKHPDADVLTAFAERALSARERAGVIEHLARCGDCREVVAMALPPVETAPVVVRERSYSFAWPLLRWGFAGLGVLLIGWFGVLQLQRSHNSVNVAKFVKQRVSSDTTTSSTNPSPAPSAAERGANAAETAKTSADAPSSRPNAFTKLPEPAQHAETASTVTNHQPHRALVGSSAGANVSGPLASMQQQQQVAIPGAVGVIAGKQAATLEQPGAVSETVEVAGAAPQVDNAENSDALNSNAQNEVATLRDQPSPAKTEDVSRAKPPQAPTASAQPTAGARLKAQSAPTANVPLNGRGLTQTVATASVAAPRWNISASGSLQRSFDQGSTWQDVNVLAMTLPPNQFASSDTLSKVAVTAELTPSKEKDAEKKNVKRENSPLTFRAVTANGADVWAGGSHGILYHSSDGGNQWMRVIPSAAGKALTDNILMLEFPDPQHGRLTTSNAEIWTTSDSGQTWQKQ